MADDGAAGGMTFFHYKDESGHDVLVNNLQDVPPKYRPHVEILDEDTMRERDQLLEVKAARLADRVKARSAVAAKERALAPERSFMGVDGPSFALGFILAFCAGFFFWSGRRSGGGERDRRFNLVMKLVVAVLGIALASTLYIGFVLKTAGLGDGSAIATPADALDEARSAVDAANAAAKAKERALEKIER